MATFSRESPSDTARWIAVSGARRTTLRLALRYGMALLSSAFTLLIYHLLRSQFGVGTPYLFALPAAAFSAWFGGPTAGILTTVTTALGLAYFEPVATGLSDAAQTEHQIALLVYLTVGAFISYLSGSMRNWRDGAEDASSRLAVWQERYRLVSETVSDFAFGYRFGADQARDELDWMTPSFGRVTGFTESQVHRPEQWSALVHGEDRETANELWAELRRGRATTREFRVITPEGEIRWLRVYARALRDDAGAVVGCVGGGQDATNRRAVESALRQSEQLYRTIVETAAEGIWTLDANWHTTFVNQRMADILGYEAAEMRGRFCGDYLFDQDLTDLDWDVMLERMRVPHEGEFRYRHKDGHEVWCQVNGTPLLDSSGGFRGAIGLCTDITARRKDALALQKNEEKYRRLADELQEADKRKDEFLAMLAHELRNPLAGISGAAQVMDKLLPEESRQLTSMPRTILARQISQLARLVDDLLDVSRITRGKIELRRQNLDYRPIIQGAVGDVEEVIRSRRHTLSLQLPEQEIKLFADPARLQQIVSNLVLNAAKYTEPGGLLQVTLKVELASDGASEEAVLTVADNGMGLKPEMLTSIWGLFVQSERTLDRSQGGLGIGLTLVRLLSEMHGGSVAARSEGPGKGSQFEIRLPMAAAEPPGPPDPPETQSEPATPWAVEAAAGPEVTARAATAVVKTRHILVVDDNKDAADALTQLLRLQGHVVTAAHSGDECLEQLQRGGIQADVVLLDIGMPGKDGYEVARSLRAAEQLSGTARPLQLIAVTGYGQPSDKEMARRAGFDAHLTKPVDNARLAELLRSGSAGWGK